MKRYILHVHIYFFDMVYIEANVYSGTLSQLHIYPFPWGQVDRPPVAVLGPQTSGFEPPAFMATWGYVSSVKYMHICVYFFFYFYTHIFGIRTIRWQLAPLNLQCYFVHFHVLWIPGTGYIQASIANQPNLTEECKWVVYLGDSKFQMPWMVGITCFCQTCLWLLYGLIMLCIQHLMYRVWMLQISTWTILNSCLHQKKACSLQTPFTRLPTSS